MAEELTEQAAPGEGATPPETGAETTTPETGQAQGTPGEPGAAQGETGQGEQQVDIGEQLDSFLSENSIPEEQGEEIREAIEDGIDLDAIKYHYRREKKVYNLEMEKLSPELKAQTGEIAAWVNGIEDAEDRDLYNLMATKARGMEKLNQFRAQSLGATGAAPNKMTGAGGMDFDTFLGEFNKATNTKDTAKLASLKEFAKNSSDPIFREFMLID